MKRMIAILCAAVLVCCAAAAVAEEHIPTIWKPNPSATLIAAIGGKSFDARINGWTSTGEDEDARVTLSVTLCERDRFDPAMIDSLAENDMVCFSDGTIAMAKEVTRDEFGVIIRDGNGDGCSFFRDENGAYIAATDTDNPFWTNVFTFSVTVGQDIRFLDWSDPENLEGPVELGYEALLDKLLAETSFTPDNTRLTFDGNGKLVEFLYSYSPWN